MQLHPTLGNATHLSYKSRLMKHKPAAFITKPRKLKAAYFRVTSNMTACSGFLTLQTQRNLVNFCILLTPFVPFPFRFDSNSFGDFIQAGVLAERAPQSLMQPRSGEGAVSEEGPNV